MGARVAVEVLGGLVGVALCARILGPEGYGVFAVLMAVTALVGGLLYLPGFEAITTYVTRGLAQGRREEAGAVLVFALGGAVATAWAAYGVVAGLTLSAGGLLGVADAHVTAMLVYATVLVFHAGHQEQLAVLRLADRVPPTLAAAAAEVLVRIAVLAWVWLTGSGGLPMVAAAYAAGALVFGVAMFAGTLAAARRAGLPLHLRFFSLRRLPRDLLRFQAVSFASTSVGAVFLNLDTILLGHLLGSAQLGLYRGARQIADICMRPFVPISLGVQAEYSRLWYGADAQDPSALRRLSSRFTVLSLVLAGGGYGLLAALHEPLIRLGLGEGFVGAAPLLLIMIPGAFVFAASTAWQALPAAAGRAGPAFAARLAALAVQVAALLVLVPAHQAQGASWAYTLHYLVFVAVVAPFAASMLRMRCTPNTSPNARK